MPERTTTNPNHPGLRSGEPQHDVYLVLSEEDRALGFVRPLRRSYIHEKCGSKTHVDRAIAETYARNPKFYGYTFCVRCAEHLPVADFVWDDGSGTLVGS